MKFLNSTVDINFIILYKNLGNFLLNAFKTYALTNLSTIFCNFSGFSNILKNKLNVIQIIHSGIRIRPVPGIFVGSGFQNMVDPLLYIKIEKSSNTVLFLQYYELIYNTVLSIDILILLLKK